MNRIILTLLAAACASGASPAWSVEYFTSYVSTSGTPTVASLWFTTADVLNANGGYDILSARGDVGGDVITGLEVNPNQPTLALSETGAFNFDNNLFGSGPLFNTNGAVFKTLSGLEYNIWSEANSTYTLASYFLAEDAPGHHAAGPTSNGTLTAATTPPPPPPVAPPTQPIVLDFNDARTLSNNVISTHGFDFRSAGNCCAYAFGNTAGNSNNQTQRMTYDLFDLTMTTNDGSAFTVTGLDAGTGSYAPADARYLLLLTGTRADGSIVTTSLDVGNAFAPYLLTGFNDLISLTFGHPTHTEIYMTFDNIAVGPSSPTPEPAIWAMFIGGFGLVGHRMRRSRAHIARA